MSTLTKFTLLLFVLLLSKTAFTQSSPPSYSYFDTIRYQETGFISTETVITDINDNGLMVGYYLAENGFYRGFVYRQNGNFFTNSSPEGNNTQFMGININNLIIGRAYDSPTSAATFKVQFNQFDVFQESEVDWSAAGQTSKEIYHINNSGVAIGTTNPGSTRFLHYQDVTDPADDGDSDRYSTGNVFSGYNYFNTFGLGINDNGLVTAYYLDGAERSPILYNIVSEEFDTLNHYNPTTGIPRTILHDINNDSLVAVEYRSPAGDFGTLAKLGTNNLLEYWNGFPNLSTLGSAVRGINNNGDIVGTYKGSGYTASFFALDKGLAIPDFGTQAQFFSFDNSDPNFEYTSSNFDYVNTDPWLNTSTNFFSTYIAPMGLNSDDSASVYNGLRNPSWPAYVRAREESKTYITNVNGQKIAKASEVHKWLTYSNLDFKGNCLGMSAMALQNFVDNTLIEGRFGNYTAEHNLNAYTTDFAFREVLASLQLSNNLPQIQAKKQRGTLMTALYNAGNLDSVQKMIKVDLDIIAKNFMDKTPNDSLSIMGIAFFDGLHAVAPYRISRAFSLTSSTDTIYVVDPNYINEPVEIVISYNPLSIIYVPPASSGMSAEQLAYIHDLGSLSLYDLGDNSAWKPEDDQMFVKSSGTNGIRFVPDNNTDYVFSSVANAADQIAVNASVFTNNWNQLGVNVKFNDDNTPDAYFLDNVAATRTAVTTIINNENFRLGYSYPEGDFIVSRQNAAQGESLIVENNGSIIEVENPDSEVKEISVRSIYSGSQEETTIDIQNITLGEDENVSIEAIDLNSLQVMNDDNADKLYDVSVNYISENQTVQWTATGINLNEQTNHTILVQETASPENQVIILVDENQDGNINDTLFGTPIMTNINSLISAEVSVYPNPSSKQLFVSFFDTNAEDYAVKVVSADGRIMEINEFTSGINSVLELNVEDYSTGVYLLEISNSKTGVQQIKQFIKE